LYDDVGIVTGIVITSDRHGKDVHRTIFTDVFVYRDGRWQAIRHFGRHIRRMRELYAGRLSVFRDSVQRRLGQLLTIPETEAGVNTVGWLGKRLNGEAVAREAAARNVEVIPINRFVLKKRRPEGLLLGLGAVDNRELIRGVRDLADAIETCGRIGHRTLPMFSCIIARNTASEFCVLRVPFYTTFL